MKKPLIAQICTALAWLGLIGGALLLIGGTSDAMNPHVPGGGGEIYAGIALIFSSITWFIAACIITLLSEIAANTKKPPPPSGNEF